MDKYRKKPIVVEAIQVMPYNLGEIIRWGNGKILDKNIYRIGTDTANFSCAVTIETSTGTHDAFSGDWIVKGVDGQFYAMPDKTFRQLYEKVEEAEPSPEIGW